MPLISSLQRNSSDPRLHSSRFPSVPQTIRNAALTDCINYNTDFSVENDGWVPFDTEGETFHRVSNGLQLDLLAPSENMRLIEEGTNLPYNKLSAKGATFASSYYMLYGNVSATIRSSPVGGSITAFILMSDTGDEIDFEFLGGDPHTVQTNFFYAGEELFTINGGLHPVPGAAVFDDFHTYTLDWRPERMQWLVDGQVVRTKEKKDTCQMGVCKYPSSPARVQFGLWDSSFDAGTAQWAKGPIDWWSNRGLSASALINHIQVKCDPEYNSIYVY
ncbi:concanavalin A-like lectin/glucanase domain-containing protein [Halteromyces radiatus]|uniref:concanavalin A-like lectin/glucanase domain-containing protein n=1 Tax=Halteromyces radiatus TaxID=101107 RepID=UPI00221ED38E|nr:concanavalin A-like lectin/glucanase domain-containing protein [Halteromyces radiatus]KAI8097143.1 concanavalin A-like lectin/glucanase domain-containing protein [Halteromyces radiatus]